MFIPPNSTSRFLIAPVRAVRSFRRHLHLIFYQEPVRRPPRPLGASGALKPSGLSGLLVQSVQSVQLGQLG